MKNTKKSWKRRKHRNGVRPERKGALKVRLRRLPEFVEMGKMVEAAKEKKIELLFAHSKFIIDSMKARTDMKPYSKEAREKYDETNTEFEEWVKYLEWAISKSLRGLSFLKVNEEQDVKALALDAIQGKQPYYHKESRHPFTCNGCSEARDCKLKDADEESKLRMCAAYNVGKCQPDNEYRQISLTPFVQNARKFLS